MELNKICEKIASDANLRAAAITKDANEKAVQLIKNANEKHSKKAEKISADAPLRAKETYERILSDATISSKKKILAEKRKIINSIFEEALNRLKNMKEEEYKALLSKKGKTITCKAEVELSEKYEKSVSDEFLKAVNPLLSKSKKTTQSGFNFVMESSRINFDFSEVLKRLSEEKVAEVAAILFF